jgi:hypothetical protein
MVQIEPKGLRRGHFALHVFLDGRLGLDPHCADIRRAVLENNRILQNSKIVASAKDLSLFSFKYGIARQI